MADTAPDTAPVSPRRIDKLTLIAIAVFVYILSTILHEGLGHGGMCLAVGGKPLVWGAYYFDCDSAGPKNGEWAARLVSAAGSTVNLVCMLVFWLWLSRDLARGPEQKRGTFSLFLWLMMALNGFDWAGYYLFSGLTGIGDWGTHNGAVLHDLPYDAIPVRVVMFIGGFLAYCRIAQVSARILGRLIGGENNRAEGRKLAWTAYFSGGTVAVLIGLLNPMGFFIVLFSAAASSFGGTSGLLWMHSFTRPAPDSAFAVKRNWPWVVTGVIATVAYAVVFGGR